MAEAGAEAGAGESGALLSGVLLLLERRLRAGATGVKAGASTAVGSARASTVMGTGAARAGVGKFGVEDDFLRMDAWSRGLQAAWVLTSPTANACLYVDKG